MPHGFTGERNLPLDQLISEYPGANFDKVKDVIDSCSLNQHQLDEIMKETEKEESLLIEQSSKFEAKIEDRLIKAYKRIRSNVKNGLAVVAVERGASGGSFFTIPPQIQMEIASRQKIITDEYSGRILVDAQLAEEEKTKINKMIEAL